MTTRKKADSRAAASTAVFTKVRFYCSCVHLTQPAGAVQKGKRRLLRLLCKQTAVDSAEGRLSQSTWTYWNIQPAQSRLEHWKDYAAETSSHRRNSELEGDHGDNERRADNPKLRSRFCSYFLQIYIFGFFLFFNFSRLQRTLRET